MPRRVWEELRYKREWVPLLRCSLLGLSPLSLLACLSSLVCLSLFSFHAERSQRNKRGSGSFNCAQSVQSPKMTRLEIASPHHSSRSGPCCSRPQRRRRLNVPSAPVLLLLSSAVTQARVTDGNQALATQTGPVPAHIGTYGAAPRPTPGPEYRGGMPELFRRQDQGPYSPGQSVCAYLSFGG